MPITKSAKKALRNSKRKRVFNMQNKANIQKAIKTLKKSATTSKADAMKALSAAYKQLDKAAKRGVIKKNTASRKKSRLAMMIKKATSK